MENKFVWKFKKQQNAMRTSVFSRKNWLIFCLIICLFQNGLFGQIAIESEKLNILLAGAGNPITIAVSDVSDSCLLLQPSTGKIIKGSKGHYLWNIGSFDTVMAHLSIFDTCNNELIGQRTFRIKLMLPEILLGGRRRSGTIERAEFKEQFGIIAQISGYDICGNCTMVGFDADFFSKKTGELWRGHNTGARFEGSVLEKQQAVMPGDWVIFRNVSYRCPGMKQPMFSGDELFFEIK